MTHSFTWIRPNLGYAHQYTILPLVSLSLIHNRYHRICEKKKEFILRTFIFHSFSFHSWTDWCHRCHNYDTVRYGTVRYEYRRLRVDDVLSWMHQRFDYSLTTRYDSRCLIPSQLSITILDNAATTFGIYRNATIQYMCSLSVVLVYCW